MLSQRAQTLKSSPTLALVSKAKELAAKGHDVISLTVGEPDWPTYPAAVKAGIDAIQTGFTKYTAAQGTIELRKAISDRIKADLNFDYNPQNEIAVTSGAKFSIFSALQVLCDIGDEVIIHSPYWVSYPTMAELAGAVPRIIHCDESVNFKLTATHLEKNINSKTKVFLFCSPSNPTGFVYTQDELKSLAAVLNKFPRVCIITDDMYNRLMFNEVKIAPHILQVAPELKNRTVVINGASKAYSMTGWRIGWAMGPEKIIKAIGDYASQSTGAACSISQKATEAALKTSELDIVKTNDMLKIRLESALNKFKEIEQFRVYKPNGAFYLWINIENVLGQKYNDRRVSTSAIFSEILLADYFVATVPGEEFGHGGYLRLSFAIDVDRFNTAVDRLKSFVKKLS
jgi:aspartate aminotransferase